MANIDTSTIQGFDTMTADEKVTALLGYSIPDAPDMSGYVQKSVFDAKATEAANLARQLKTKTTEAETSSTALASANAELSAMKQNAYIASKGFTGDEAEFIAFKALKNVNDKTTFEQAVDAIVEEKKGKQTVDLGGSVGGGSSQDSPNKAMNDLIRKAFK